MTTMNKNFMIDVYNNIMDSRTIRISPISFTDDIYITRDNGAMIRVSPFEVEEYSDDDITTEWIRAERCIDVYLCYSLTLHYIETVIIDYKHDDMYTEIEAVEAEAENLAY